MKAYKTYSTITETKQVVLSNVPFGVGEKVEIVVLAADSDNRAEHLETLKNLFKETQSLQQIQTLTDKDIELEIEAFRNRR